MRKLYFIVLLMACFSSDAAIKFFTDYPNTTPLDSDFFVLQRNQSYINSSPGQVRATWFNNPVFTGTVTGLTNITFITVSATTNINNYDFTTNLIVNKEFVTNITVAVPGGFTNLNLTPKTVMYADVNDAESSIPNAVGVLTNNGTGGIGFNNKIQLDEIDAQNFYPTNMYTFLTNAAFLKTDGDGKVTAGVELPGTNVLLSAGANITFTTNGSGGITITGSSTNTVDTSTNNLIVVTNIIVYSNLTVLQNLFVSTNFSTNQYFVSGKGNTLIITNNLNLIYLSASKLVATDGAKNLTNADVSADLTFSGNVVGLGTKGTAGTYTKTTFDANGRETSGTSAVLASSDFANQGTTTTVLHGNAAGNPSWTSVANADLANSSITIQNAAVSLGGSTLAQGSKPVFDLQSSTNLLLSSVSSPTNGVSTASSIDFTLAEAVTNIAGAVSQTSLANFNQTNINHAIRYYVNRTGSDQTITVGTWETDSGRQTATTYICTNNTTLALMFSMYAGQFTNVTSYKTFR